MKTIDKRKNPKNKGNKEQRRDRTIQMKEWRFKDFAKWLQECTLSHLTNLGLLITKLAVFKSSKLFFEINKKVFISQLSYCHAIINISVCYA